MRMNIKAYMSAGTVLFNANTKCQDTAFKVHKPVFVGHIT